MVSISEPELPSAIDLPRYQIRESKIVHKSPILHPLARFITEETAAMMFGIDVEDIYRITCLRYVVHVHGKGVSRFVSYADFPPISAVNPPTVTDFVFWHKRWRKKSATEFWQNFYTHQFQQAVWESELLEWGKIVNLVKSLLSETGWQNLQDIYIQKKSWL
ncbi:hypothetical protein [Aerosakkonema funiforme]|uniref:hypothetical protein n=1 Tax=Aerosakkonema funiforme TaxID=1246630 RepID=UPI0035B923EF